MNIKEKIANSKVRQWEIAEKIGVNEFTLSRYLRRPNKLSKEKLQQIIEALEKLEKGDHNELK